MPNGFIYTTDDVLIMLDGLLADRGGDWWTSFFTDRTKPIPFFVDWPDENLVEWFDTGRLAPRRVLELGSGQGRNAVFLAGRGCQVDAIDFSPGAVEWAIEKAATAGVSVNFRCSSIFDAPIEDGAYDLVYDSGCFHHLPPHRRRSYVDLVARALRPGGSFGLVCFRPEVTDVTDEQVYRQRSLGGGLGYTEDQLRGMWDADPFSVRVLRRMNAHDVAGPAFGADFLWTLLATREPHDQADLAAAPGSEPPGPGTTDRQDQSPKARR